MPRAVNPRVNVAAIVPRMEVRPPAHAGGTDLCDASRRDLFGSILTGEMFAPILAEQIDRYNTAFGTCLNVLAVPNTYFGGDVSVAGLLSGQDYRAIADKIEGDFVIIPKHTIKSDEPILIDGMSFDELKSIFPVPVYDLDTDGLMAFLSK